MDSSALRKLEGPGNVRAKFYFDEIHNREMCKIWVVGDNGDLLKKVTPELIAQWPNEWES